MRRTLPVLIASATLLAGLAAPAQAGRTATVTLEDIEFKPGVRSVRSGDRVRFVWKDGATPHNVRSRGALRFRSAGARTEGSHTVRLTRRGTYRYVCTIHLGMDGQIKVR